MPVWSREEIQFANNKLFGHKSSEVLDRYEKWGGIPRYVLQLVGSSHQSMLDHAIGACRIEMLKYPTYMIWEQDKGICHTLFHMTVQRDFSYGNLVLALAYVKDKLMEKYVQSRKRDVKDFLLTSYREPDFVIF